MRKKNSLSAEFDQLQSAYCRDVVRFLQNRGYFFSLVCAIRDVSFEPMLPKSILELFQPISMFVIAGYTFESLRLGSNGMSFEAGFGSENIGACVQMDYTHILQIAMTAENQRDTVLFSRLNCAEIFGAEDSANDELNRSMEAILSNPHNQKFFH